MPTLEVICATVEDVRQAVIGGADSLELCVALDVGGLTPPLALVQAARDLAPCRLNALVRPHAASFTYNATDRDHIFSMIDYARALGVDGVVFGALTRDGTLDLPLMQQVAAACGDLTLTMHRALDVMPDPDAALTQLVGADLPHCGGRRRNAGQRLTGRPSDAGARDPRGAGGTARRSRGGIAGAALAGRCLLAGASGVDRRDEACLVRQRP